MEEEKLDSPVVDGEDNDKKETLDEDENVTAEVFEQTNNLVEESRGLGESSTISLLVASGL